ncbi:MAG TPA: MBL fold metallo-hydrolase [Chitinophagales bacterium]|nr:MBL fold metallo-hydrolase [Chitinophagales bacterium]HNM31217.1 MBL fold metallo-hydrolase [Chitinophagales bacterium]
MVKRTLKALVLIVLVVIGLSFSKFMFLGKKLNVNEIKPYITASSHQHQIQLTYLGCAGFIVEYKNKSILFDPFISNPNVFNFNKKYTEWPSVVQEKKLKTIDLVAISHGHYDHCYDTKNLIPFIQSNSKIIADQSVINELHPIFNTNSLQAIALQFDKPQTWQYNTDSTFRIFPLQSTHSPHIGKLEFFKGRFTTPQLEIPQKIWQWKKGEDYSYLIDVLNKDSVVYRMILVNGNIAPSGIAALKELSKQRVSDIQLQIFWKESLVIENMMMVYAIVHPRQIILQHWNNFFVSFDKPLQYLRDSHLPEVLKKYNQQDLKTSIMLPFTTVDL